MRRIVGRGQEAAAKQTLRPLLLDENVLVISTFELNKIASLTYGDLVCDDIFEFIETIISKPLQFTPLALHKTLVLLKHVLIYGSAKCVNSGYGIGAFVESLQKYNTILIAQQRGGPGAMFQRVIGGGVDKGGDVREVAIEICKLLSNMPELQRIRNESASEDSLVPVGDTSQVGFVTDEVRLHVLKKKIENHQRVHIKSNLAKSQGGFGGGYNAKDGSNVVGAAHGIEEMIKMANKEKKKFSDEQNAVNMEEEKILKELMAEAQAAKQEAKKAEAKGPVDLLGFNEKPAQDVDLLGFGGVTNSTINTTAANTDIFGGNDLLGNFSQPPAAPVVSKNDDSFGFATMTQPKKTGGNGQSDPFGLAPVALGPVVEEAKPKMNPSVMSSNKDHFSALDALAEDLRNSTMIKEMPAEMPPPPPVDQGGYQESISMETPHVKPGSGQVATQYSYTQEDNDDNPWVMGGSAGTGLGEPITPAPAGAPPPPPPPPP